MQSRHMGLIAALIVPGLTGCGTTDTPALAEARIDTLPGGLVQVTNPGPTAWSDTNGWRLVPERVIQPAEGSNEEIGRTSGMAADSAGNVYILESGPARIRVYDNTGHWVHDIGREGPGPGEIMGGMFTLAANRFLVVSDPNGQRLTVFTTDGSLFSTSTSQCCVWSSTFTAFADSTMLIPGASPVGAAPGTTAWYLTRLDGRVIDTILSVGKVMHSSGSSNGTWVVVQEINGGRSITAVGIPLQPRDQGEYFSTRQQVSGNNSRYQLAITSLHGDTLRLFSAPAAEVRISSAQRDSLFEDKMQGLSEPLAEGFRAIASASDIPTTWPAWTSLKVDGANRIWVMRPGPKGGNSLLDVFTPEGVLLGSVPVPHQAIMEGYWTADHVYLLTEDQQGFPEVLVYRIEMESP